MRIKKGILTCGRKKKKFVNFNLQYKEEKGVEITAKGQTIVCVSNKNVKIQEDYMKIEHLSKSKNKVFIISKYLKDFDFKADGYEGNSINVKADIGEKDFYVLIYSIAYGYYLEGNGDKAIYFMSKIAKDKYLANCILNSFTLEERKRTKLSILKAALEYKNSRFIDGKLKGREGLKENVFCFLDLLKNLKNNGDKFVPIKEYKRIGRKIKDHFNMFTIDKECESLGDFKDIVYNRERMNISIRYKINGHVTINPRQAKANGLFNNVFKAYIYREQTFIKDGNKNIEKFEAIITRKTYEYLINKKLDKIFSVISHDGNTRRVMFDIRSIPIINKKYLRKSENLDVIMELCIKQKVAEARKKVINHFIKQKSNLTNLKYTIEQITLLNSYGLSSDGCYSGIDNKKENVEGVYESKVFDFSIKGLSTIPKVEEVLLRNKEGKKLNFLSKIMLECIEEVKDKDYISKMVMLDKEKDVILECKRKVTELKLAKYLSGGLWKDLECNSKGEFLYKKNENILIIKVYKKDKEF